MILTCLPLIPRIMGFEFSMVKSPQVSGYIPDFHEDGSINLRRLVRRFSGVRPNGGLNDR